MKSELGSELLCSFYHQLGMTSVKTTLPKLMQILKTYNILLRFILLENSFSRLYVQ